MILDGEPLTGMPSPEMFSVTLTFKICKVFLTMFGLAMTLTFDLLTTKYYQFISVPNCT